MNFESNNIARDLQPIFEMLQGKSQSLERVQWESLVALTRKRVIAAPEQYLSGINQPSQELTLAIEAFFLENFS